MVRQFFDVDDSWDVACYYDVHPCNIGEVAEAIASVGGDGSMAKHLSEPNTGLTYTSMRRRTTVMAMSYATSTDELYDTIQHELKHAVEHIGERFGVDSKGETSAYLQGYLAKRMFPAVAMVVCPKRSHESR